MALQLREKGRPGRVKPIRVELEGAAVKRPKRLFTKTQVSAKSKDDA